MIEHYRAVSAQGGLPVVLYNVPGRTGCDLQPTTVAELRDDPNIIGLKEARGDEGRWEALYPLGGAGFALLSGDDPTFLRAVRRLDVVAALQQGLGHLERPDARRADRAALIGIAAGRLVARVGGDDVYDLAFAKGGVRMSVQLDVDGKMTGGMLQPVAPPGR